MKRILISCFAVILAAAAVYSLYLQFLIGVARQSQAFYGSLKKELESRGFQSNYVVLSTVRPPWFNSILVYLSGAAPRSQHIEGTAIDILVLDVNGDSRCDATDVRIVYSILDTRIVGNGGGLGTYLNESNFFSRQMVHFDSRGYRARWR
ncbi:MAG: DUF882 domain-containing protein [Leptospiraceae bacterium]|nr:DUF882 domain-containing protein [Leptospiraceae bacterium]